MSNSVQLYTNIAAPQSSFSFPFSYLEAVDITAYVDGVVVFQNNASTGTAVGGNTYVVAFSAPDSTTLTFSPAVVAGSDVRIQRNTDLTTKAVDFADGAVLTELALDTAIDQVFFGSQEAIDKANDSVTVDTDDKWDAQSKVIKNVANPVNAQDAATKDYLENTWLSTSDKAQLNALNLSNLNTVATDVANVNTTATNIADVNTVATNISDVNTLAAIDADVSIAAANITDIQNAATNASTATTKAAEAVVSADLAEDWAEQTTGIVNSTGYSAKAWATGGTDVTNTAGAGASQEWATKTTANVDGTEFSAKEYAIGSQAANADGSAKQWALGGGSSYSSNTTVDGVNYSAKYWAEQAAASADNFDDTYLGPKSSAPTVDNDGDPLNTGDLYFDTTSNNMFVYNGTAWQQTAVSTTGLATAGFSIAMAVAL